MASETTETEIEGGDVFVDIHGDEYVVESVGESGQVHFEDFYDHWVSEVEGFVEDGLWERRSQSGGNNDGN